ncbi:MAG: BMP family ABC transporter substrate-binding protein [Coriobacteriia bacterium]|nr:BMP family ABC transporter substrate-binding protein [Coriobacteriia bacterium]
MRVKRVLVAVLAVLLVAGLAACGPTKTDNSANTDNTNSSEKALKIAIITSPSGVDDGSFNQNNYEGIKAFIGKHSASTVTPIRQEDQAKSIQSVQDAVADYDVIVTPGYQFAGITKIAQENPDKKFILVDAFPADPADASGFKTTEAPNIYAMQFAEQESGFYAGVAAAMESTSGKVAVMNGQAFPSNVHYQRGFEAGVQYANKHNGTKATCVSLPSYAGMVGKENIGGNYVGSFADPAKGKVVAEALIAQGVDVIFPAAGFSGSGAFTAAKESNGKVKVIGCDVNQWNDGKNGDANVVLTSVLKVMDVQVERQLENILNDSFKGANVTLHAKDDGTGFVSTEGQQQLSAKTLDALKAAEEGIKNGTIVPPTGDAGDTTSPTAFPGL